MKYLNYIVRNILRNPVRTALTVASTGITLFLMMILVSFFDIRHQVGETLRVYNRLITMSSQGFASPVPIARVKEIGALEGVEAVSPFSWYGGKYNNQTMPFAQFGIDADTIFTIYPELTVPPTQLKAFQEDRAGCVIGVKLASDRGLKIGDPLPLQGDIYPVDLKLTVRAIYNGPPNRDLRGCFFHWIYLDEELKRSAQATRTGNAGIVVIKCKNADVMTALARKIDAEYRNSDTPTITQSEEAFNKIFAGMLQGLQTLIVGIGLAVVLSLVLVAGNAMAMALRERTTEIAVLKAIGYSRGLVLFLVLAEAMVVAGLGGLLGSFGCKVLCDVVDVAKYSAGFLPFFFVSLSNAVLGLVLALLIGFFSGIVPALVAARSSVIQGLRKVV